MRSRTLATADQHAHQALGIAGIVDQMFAGQGGHDFVHDLRCVALAHQRSGKFATGVFAAGEHGERPGAHRSGICRRGARRRDA